MITKNFIDSIIMDCPQSVLVHIFEAYLPIVHSYEKKALDQDQKEVATSFKQVCDVLVLACRAISETKSFTMLDRSHIKESIKLCERAALRLVEMEAQNN